MNSTVPSLEGTHFVRLSHAIAGCVAIVMNIVALIYISRLKSDHSTTFTVQMLFICVNDVGSGIAFFLRPLVDVRSVTAGYTCAYIMVLVIVSDTVSKGNMFCICLQRYVFARHIRTTVTTWRRIHTIGITAANILMGMCVAAILVPMLDATKDFYPMAYCTLETVRKQDGPNTFALLFIVQVLIILSSDVVCVMTVLKLREVANAVRPTGILSTIGSNESSSSSSGLTVRRISQRRQLHAIVTILIILVVFNLSYIPITCVSIFNMTGRPVDPVEYAYGLIMLVTLVPCYVNPLLIVIRVQDITAMIRSDCKRLKSALLRSCARN